LPTPPATSSSARTNYVKKVDTNGVVTVVAGTGTGGYNGEGIAATAALVNACNGITLVGTDVVIAEAGNHRVRRISGGVITTVAGDGTAAYAGDGGPASAAKVNARGPWPPTARADSTSWTW
jgi:hypothetical protein